VGGCFFRDPASVGLKQGSFGKMVLRQKGKERDTWERGSHVGGSHSANFMGTLVENLTARNENNCLRVTGPALKWEGGVSKRDVGESLNS